MSKKLVFETPPGMTAPEGKEKGDTFEVPAVLKIEGDGKLCLVSVSGLKLKGYEEKDEDESPDEEMEEGEDEFMGGLEREYASQRGSGSY